MPCKICGKPFKPRPNITAAALLFPVTPNCRCGAIRKRLRKEGCKKCGAHDDRLQLKKIRFGWKAYCTCGKVWWVRK